MPRRHDEHTLDGGNVSPLALPWQQTDEPDDGATHLGTLNTSAPTRREQQHNQPNDDDIGDAVDLLGTLNDSRRRGESGNATSPMTTTSVTPRPAWDVERRGAGAARATAQPAQ
jgi:hypothetical protein